MMIGVGRTHKLSPIRRPPRVVPKSTLNFRSTSIVHFNNAGLMLGFLEPGGSPRPGVTLVVLEKDPGVYRVILNDAKFDSELILRKFRAARPMGVQLIDPEGDRR